MSCGCRSAGLPGLPLWLYSAGCILDVHQPIQPPTHACPTDPAPHDAVCDKAAGSCSGFAHAGPPGADGSGNGRGSHGAGLRFEHGRALRGERAAMRPSGSRGGRPAIRANVGPGLSLAHSPWLKVFVARNLGHTVGDQISCFVAGLKRLGV